MTGTATCRRQADTQINANRTPNSMLGALVPLIFTLSLCVSVTGCGRRSAPVPVAPKATPQTAVAPSQAPAPVVTNTIVPPAALALPPSTFRLPPPTSHLPPSTSHLPPASPARQVATLVRTADDAVRATPAGSQAWANVIQMRAAYSDRLKQDAQYRELTARLARIEEIAATNAPGDAGEVGTAMAQRERALVRDVPEAARARAAVERAESAYGALVQADARYVESVKLIKTMGTNEAQEKAP